MEEKILIKSELDKKARKTFRYIIIGLLLVALLSLFLGIIIGNIKRTEIVKEEYDWFWQKHYTFEEFAKEATWLESVFMCGLVWFILHWSFIFVAGIFAIIYWVLSKCELILTDKNAKGKTLFGKEVVLPIHMISAYSTRRFLSTVAITTASGITKFSLIGNYKDIGNILQNLINERQSNTQMSVSTIPAENNGKLDDLKKLKDLLDNGIISQEEFDTKKKQILGL